MKRFQPQRKSKHIDPALTISFNRLLKTSMTSLTRRYPIVPVPEEHCVSSVRIQVINKVCRLHNSLELAISTKRVFLSMQAGRDIPVVVITSLSRTRSP